jgi:hypothetical protein
MYGPEVTEELQKFVPLEMDATDCWRANFAEGQVSDMRFGLLVGGPAPHDDPGVLRYNFELEATIRESGRKAESAGVCLDEDGGIVCSPECDGGAARISMRPNGDVLVRAESIRMYYCGEQGEEVHVSGHYHLTAAAPSDCPVVDIRDPEAGVE